MIHCVHCPLPVHPTRGGAYCVAHTPVDLTGGVAPHDRLAECVSSKGHPVVPRMLRGEPDARLRAAGWEPIDPPGRGYLRWRNAGTGLVRTRAVALRLMLREAVRRAS